MTPHLILSGLLASTTTTTTKSSSASAAGNIIFLLVIVAIGYFLWRSFGRQRQQQAARTRDLLVNLSAGDEVLTGAGIFGTVLDVEGDRVTLETAPGTRITVLRSTIARRIEPEDVAASGGATLDELGEEPGVVRDEHQNGHDGHHEGHLDDGEGEPS